MVTVIEAKPVPKTQITCGNCKSVLEYGNADLSIDYEAERDQSPYRLYASGVRSYCLTCPVCGCKVSASWIINKEQNNNDC